MWSSGPKGRGYINVSMILCFGFQRESDVVATAMAAELRIVVHASTALIILALEVRKRQCCVVRRCTNMKQPSPNQASEMHQWSVQLREHLAHLLLPPGTNCSLSSVCVTPPSTTEGYKAILTSLKQ